MPSDYDQIRADNIREYGEGTRHLSFLGRLYTDRTHFIFELLQNAEDAGATRILFELSEKMLEVKHDGRPFNELDVRGVCGVGEGTKAEDLTQIGKFGIGFKSVYAYTSSPEVHSGEPNYHPLVTVILESTHNPVGRFPRGAGLLTFIVQGPLATLSRADASCGSSQQARDSSSPRLAGTQNSGSWGHVCERSYPRLHTSEASLWVFYRPRVESHKQPHAPTSHARRCA